MTWVYQNKELTEAPEDFVGFVYLITNHNTNKKYIGKKLFWSTNRVKQKGKSRRRVVRKQSDWRDYFGSNQTLLEDIQVNGENIEREILHLCRTKGECSYFEAKEQFDRNVLLDDTYYNQWIAVKVTVKHIKK